jgi:hypothetical protein
MRLVRVSDSERYTIFYRIFSFTYDLDTELPVVYQPLVQEVFSYDTC